MPRIVQDNFSKGMITDVVGAPDSLFLMRDMYLRRPNEICSRGAIGSRHQNPALDSNYDYGYSTALFHPNFGTGAVRGMGTAFSGGFIWNAPTYQLVGADLETNASAGNSDNDLLDFNIITENGSGTTKSMVCTGYNAGTPSWYSFQYCDQVVNVGNEMIFAGVDPGGTGDRIFKWGGSQLAAYSTGTVAVTTSASGSRIITGTGTTWGANVEAGQYILIDTIAEKASGEQRAFRITNVFSNTELEIEAPVFLAASNSGLSYRIQSVACVSSPDGVWNGTDEFPRQQGIIAYWQNKLWCAGVSDNTTDYNTVSNFDRIKFSGTPLEEATSFFGHMDLWASDASLDIEPGTGGRIMGLVPFGNELVVIKAHAIYKITGQGYSYNAAGTAISGPGYQLTLIADGVGATSRKSFAVTKAGIVIASTDGLYLYNEEGIQSITDGRVNRWWEANFLYRSFVVNALEDKVIIQQWQSPYLYSTATSNLVWMIDGDYFWEMSSNKYSTTLATYTANDEWVQDIGFPATYIASAGNGKATYHRLSQINHLKTFVTTLGGATDDYTADSNPEIVTHPLRIGSDPVSEGRVNNVLLHAISLDGTTENIVSLLPGSTAPSFDGVGSATVEGTATEVELEYTLSQGTTDRAHRIPVDDMDPAVSCRIRIDASTSTEPNPYRIYALGLEFEPSNVTGPT